MDALKSSKLAEEVRFLCWVLVSIMQLCVTVATKQPALVQFGNYFAKRRGSTMSDNEVFLFGIDVVKF